MTVASRSYRLKHSLNNCASVIGSALAAAVPVVGLGIFSLGLMFNDSPRDRGLQSLTLVSHLAGVGGLLLAGATSDPTFLGVAGVGLGVLEARNTGGPETTPFERSTMYSFPKV